MIGAVTATMLIDNQRYSVYGVVIKNGGIQTNQSISHPIYDVVLIDVDSEQIIDIVAGLNPVDMIDRLPNLTIVNRAPPIRQIKNLLRDLYPKLIYRSRSLSTIICNDVIGTIKAVIDAVEIRSPFNVELSKDVASLIELSETFERLNKQIGDLFDRPFYLVRKDQLIKTESKIIRIVRKIGEIDTSVVGGSVPLVDRSVVDDVIDRIRAYNNLSI